MLEVDIPMAGSQAGKMEVKWREEAQADIHKHKLESTRGYWNFYQFFLPLTWVEQKPYKSWFPCHKAKHTPLGQEAEKPK